MYELSEMEKSDSVSYQIVHNDISDVSVGVMNRFFITMIQMIHSEYAGNF